MVVLGRSLSRIHRRVAMAAVLVLLGLCLSAGPAAAHASLVGSDPKDGQVLASAPKAVTFAFNEPVRSVPGGVRLFDSGGAETDVGSRTRDATLVVDLPEGLGRGTFVIAWRVVSEDGHPIAGALTFSVGARSVTQAIRVPTPESSPAVVTALLSAARASVYLGIFSAVGLSAFLVLLLPRTVGLDDVRQRALAFARGGALVTLVGAVGAPAMAVLYQRADGLEGLSRSELWVDVLTSTETLSSFLSAFGTALAVYFARTGQLRAGDRIVSLGAAALALGSVALVGHTRSESPLWLMVAADLSHVLAGAVWFGGLVGVVIGLRQLRSRPRVAAVLVGRFSALAAGSLALVAVSGAVLAQRILGSWDALFHTDFGRVLLVKTGIVVLVVLIAAWNRFRLMPAVLASAPPASTDPSVALRRSIRAEAVLLVAVLGLTGFLVDRSPAPQSVSASSAPRSTYEGQAGSVRVVAVVDPVAIGRNTIVLRLSDATGKALVPNESPMVAAAQGDLSLAERTTRRVAGGAYRMVLVLPRGGTWNLQVSVRVSRFENPVVPIEIVVPTTR